MEDTRGFYEKYEITRKDGREIKGPTFTFEIGGDRDCWEALSVYADTVQQKNPELAADLRRTLKEARRKAQGPYADGPPGR